jgi:hypothetical protein
MTESKSSVAFETICREPLTLNEIARLVVRLRALGVRVVDAAGNDLSQSDIEALKEFLQ